MNVRSYPIRTSSKRVEFHEALFAVNQHLHPLEFSKLAAAWMVAVITEEHHESLVQNRLEHMASHRVGHRPNRIEPRAIKRRPKPHDLLTEPRDQAGAKLLAAAAT